MTPPATPPPPPAARAGTNNVFAALLAALAGLVLGGAVHAGDAAARSGFYLSAGAGASWLGDFRQKGRNREQDCYYDNCAAPASHGGYRWNYAVDTDTGFQYDLAAGWLWNRLRFEVAAGQSRNGATHSFRGLRFFNGGIPGNRNPADASDDSSGIGRVEIRSLFASVYYDFAERGGFIPYLGAGIGKADVTVESVRFSSIFTNDNRRIIQDEDMGDSSYAWQAHAGFDYRVRRDLLAGLKVSYTDLSDFSDTELYDEHTREPNLTNTTRFAGMSRWSALFTVKYLFGR